MLAVLTPGFSSSWCCGVCFAVVAVVVLVLIRAFSIAGGTAVG